MDTTIENMALLNIDEYNDLKAKADATEEQVKAEAAKIAKPEIVTLRVCFDTYGVAYKPYTCISIDCEYYDNKAVRDMLDKANDTIQEWCDNSMKKYWKEIKDSKSTKRDCEGLKKHIANLEKRLLKHALINVILFIVSVAAIIALFILIQN